jgi:hypothetical protein
VHFADSLGVRGPVRRETIVPMSPPCSQFVQSGLPGRRQTATASERLIRRSQTTGTGHRQPSGAVR